MHIFGFTSKKKLFPLYRTDLTFIHTPTDSYDGSDRKLIEGNDDDTEDKTFFFL